MCVIFTLLRFRLSIRQQSFYGKHGVGTVGEVFSAGPVDAMGRDVTTVVLCAVGRDGRGWGRPGRILGQRVTTATLRQQQHSLVFLPLLFLQLLQCHVTRKYVPGHKRRVANCGADVQSCCGGRGCGGWIYGCVIVGRCLLSLLVSAVGVGAIRGQVVVLQTGSRYITPLTILRR